MLQGFFVGPAFLSGELAGAFIQLRGHVGGFFSRTAEGDQDFGQFGSFHGFPRLQVGVHASACSPDADSLKAGLQQLT